MVTVTSLSKCFGHTVAVSDVSFTLSPGTIVGLLGPNGAGKSTTIRMVTGFILPDSGTVTVDGFDTVENARDAAMRIGYLPESTPLYPEMRVEEFLHFRGRLYGMGWRARNDAITRVVSRCWLQSVRRRPIRELSKGYKQRVGLACAMLHDPKVLILDEPTNGLDPTQIQETRNLVREVGQDRTMLISSHILPEVERLCDRLIVIAGGTVRGDGTAAELMERVRGMGMSRKGALVRFAPRRTVVGAAEILRGIPGVIDVREIGLGMANHDGAFELTCVNDAAVDGVAIVVEGLGWGVRELGAVRPSLEEVFGVLTGVGGGR